MQKLFSNPAELEKLSKEKFSIPPFLMMENAAKAMADFILSKSPDNVLIVCGKGNNGGDGYALARMMMDKCKVTVLPFQTPTASEACQQYSICQKLETPFISTSALTEYVTKTPPDVIVDCLYGIGFHGELSGEAKSLLDQLNQVTCLKIACDCASGNYFKADYTITMGEQKLALYSDKAKSVCGQIIVADLGLPRNKFEASTDCQAFLLETSDAKPPVRNNPSAHKGSFGHTTIFTGDKAGAGILAATAALNFGSGLTTLLQTPQSNLNQFKITPELMLSPIIPEKTSAVVIGPGISTPDFDYHPFVNWIKTTKNPAAVLDAGMFNLPDIWELLKTLNDIPNAKVVLTPHLSELNTLLNKLGITSSTSQLSSDSDFKVEAGKQFMELFPNITLVMKSANTFIASENQIFVYADGCQSLAKGGSGDVLAGMTGALLSQGYSAKDAAITAVILHGNAARKFGPQNYDLTPEKLIAFL